MKKALYCLDRKEENILVFENLETLERLELYEDNFDVRLSEGDIVEIVLDGDGNAVSIEKNSEETSRRKEKNAKKLKSLFDN